jgi:hypothetical protein
VGDPELRKRGYLIAMILISVIYLPIIVGYITSYLMAMNIAGEYRMKIRDLTGKASTAVDSVKKDLKDVERYRDDAVRYIGDSGTYIREGALESARSSLLNALDSLLNSLYFQYCASASLIDASDYLNKAIGYLDGLEDAYRSALSSVEDGLIATIFYLVILYLLIKRYKRLK